MISVAWTEEKLITLNRMFLRKVLDNMRGYKGAVVSFGVTGEGIQPNYQITFPNGNTNPISGMSHKAFNFKEDNADEFDPSKISQPFTFAQIELANRSFWGDKG